jgi:ribosomal protein S18 acetylase RimI-like enzyme
VPHLVRLATLTDVDALVRLMRQYRAETNITLSEHTAARAFETLLDDSRLGQVWMIEDDGHSAGYVVLTVSFSVEYSGLRGFIDEFYVAAQYRRRGLGHSALEEVKRACRRRGVRALLVDTARTNEPALSAYRRAGFTDAGRAVLSLPLV